MTIFRRGEVVGHTYVKHVIRVQYVVVSIAVYGRLQHLIKTLLDPIGIKISWVRIQDLGGNRRL